MKGSLNVKCAFIVWDKTPLEWKAKLIHVGARPQTFKCGMVNSGGLNSRPESCWDGEWHVEEAVTACGWEDVVGVQNTCCDQEEQNSHRKLDLLGVHPRQSKSVLSAKQWKAIREKIALSPSTAESSFLQRLIYLIFWHQNAIKKYIQNCMKLTRSWFQSTDKLYSFQTSITGWGSDKFFHHWHSQLCRVLRNPPGFSFSGNGTGRNWLYFGFAEVGF